MTRKKLHWTDLVADVVDIFREGVDARRRRNAKPITLYGKTLDKLTDIEFDMALQVRPCPNCGDDKSYDGSTHEEWCPMHAEWERRGGFDWKAPER